ncbi:MAG: permease [Candidatus Altiarchaeota archaeon]
MIEWLCDLVVYGFLGLSEDTAFGKACHFFLYDTVKILLLLYLMIAFIGVLRTYIPQNKIKVWLSRSRYGAGYVMASAFGALTPFCSCSSIPIFISFLKAGVPIGPSFSFLVTSPLINEYLTVLMLGFFGWRITAAYVLFGMALGVMSGILVNSMHLESEIESDMKSTDDKAEKLHPRFRDRMAYGMSEASSIVRKLWLWVMVGVGIGAVIHGFIPAEAIESAISATGVFSVPIAALIGIPIYANCSAVVPIALVLFQKGMPLGTALAFMMATAALSLPEAVILRRAMKIRLIIAFFGLVAGGIILIGYVFNFLEKTMV